MMLRRCHGNPCGPIIDQDPARLVLDQGQQSSDPVTVAILGMDREGERPVESIDGRGELIRSAVMFEARTLAGMDTIASVDDLVEAARRIADLGPRYVVKGGVELPGDDAVDVYFDSSHIEILRAPKIGNARVAGAGCTLAAAITAALAKGSDTQDAVCLAKEFTTAGIADRISARTPFDAVWQGAHVETV